MIFGMTSITGFALPDLRRVAGLAAAVGTQALFAVTVVYLFTFLRYGVDQQAGAWLIVDTLLALQFAVPHSLLLHPSTRKALSRWISSEFYGLFFCLGTCGSLAVVFCFWQACPTTIWDLSGVPEMLMLTGFFASWAGLLYSISLTGLGFQTGWTQWSHWYRKSKMPRRDFRPNSLYHWFRHPIYLCFLGLIWFTPRMTMDRAVLTGIWSVYIFVGSVLKDQRLAFYLGESYRNYQRQVPGYPLMLWGPLAKLRYHSEGSQFIDSQTTAQVLKKQASAAETADLQTPDTRMTCLQPSQPPTVQPPTVQPPTVQPPTVQPPDSTLGSDGTSDRICLSHPSAAPNAPPQHYAA